MIAKGTVSRQMDFASRTDHRESFAMFSDTSTPFDLRFRFLGFPCSISGLFWVGALLLSGANLAAPNGFQFLLAWIAALLISILVHELGHAIAARTFGCRVLDVRLTMMGGFCAYDREPPVRWQRIAISLAGPAAGFLLWGLLKGGNYSFDWDRRAIDTSLVLAVFLEYMYFINLIWGFFNLLPILPMDGGRVCYELCGAAKVQHPYITARWIGVFTASTLAILGLLITQGVAPPAIVKLLPDWFEPSTLRMIWLALFAVQNYMEIQQVKGPSRRGQTYYEPDDEGEEWKKR